MTQSDRICKLKFATWLIITGLLVATEGNCAFAQIESDRTLGDENSVVQPNVVINGTPSDRIDGGARRGANPDCLTHLFEES